MQYVKNPNLAFIPAKADRKGNPFDGTEYRYERDAFRPEWSKVARMLFSPNPQKQEKKKDAWAPTVAPGADYLADKRKNWIVWLGHASFLIQLDGIRILTDPQLLDMPFLPRRAKLPFSPADLRDLDYLLLSHDHRDHVDKTCIQQIVSNNLLRGILCPLGLTRTIQDWVDRADAERGMWTTAIQEAAWYQIYDLHRNSPLRITFLPARHWCRRGLTDFNRSLWGSFMIERLGAAADAEAGAKEGASRTDELVTTATQPTLAGVRTIYFGGDSAQTEYWKEIGELYPEIDVAMLGIGAYAPSFMMKGNHANPAEAFKGFKDLGARYWWPMHYGTYDLSWEPPREPITWAKRLMVAAKMEDRLVEAVVNLPVIITGEHR